MTHAGTPQTAVEMVAALKASILELENAKLRAEVTQLRGLLSCALGLLGAANAPKHVGMEAES